MQRFLNPVKAAVSSGIKRQSCICLSSLYTSTRRNFSDKPACTHVAATLTEATTEAAEATTEAATTSIVAGRSPCYSYRGRHRQFSTRAAAPASTDSHTFPTSWRLTSLTQQERQQCRQQALRLLQLQQLFLLPYGPHTLEPFAAPEEADEAATFAVATAAAKAAAADGSCTAATAAADNGGDTAERIKTAFFRGDWRNLVGIAEKLLQQQHQQQELQQTQKPDCEQRQIAPALFLLSLLHPPQRDRRVLRLVSLAAETLQRQEVEHTPGECAALIAALGNFRVVAACEGFAPHLSDCAFGAEAAAAISRMFVTGARLKLPSSSLSPWAPPPSQPASLLFRRLLNAPRLSPEQTSALLQAVAYTFFFPSRLSLLLLPEPSPAPAATAAAAARWGQGVSSPAPVYLESSSFRAEAADTPEALGLAAAVTAALSRITAELRQQSSRRSSGELLSLEGLFRLTEALMLRDIAFSTQLTPLAQQQQQQQVQQLWDGYKQELNELLLLMLGSMLRQEQQWGVCTSQELLLFLLSLLRIFGIGNPERLALTAALSCAEKQQQEQQHTWQQMSQQQEGDTLPDAAHKVLRGLLLRISKDGCCNSTAEAALLLRAVSLLCSSSKTFGMVSFPAAPCGAAAAAAAPKAASFGEGAERWGQQQLLQWQLAAAADFAPLPLAVLQQQQRDATYVLLKEQQQRAAEFQATAAAQLLKPAAAAAAGPAAAAAALDSTFTTAAKAAATALEEISAIAAGASAKCSAEGALCLSIFLKIATESVFRFSAFLSSAVSMLLLRSFVSLNSLQQPTHLPTRQQEQQEQQQQHTEAWELLLARSGGEILLQKPESAAAAAAAAFRASAILQLYRQLQRQRLALLHEQQQHKQERPELQEQQHQVLRSRLRQLRQSLRCLRLQQVFLLEFLYKNGDNYLPTRYAANILVGLAAGGLLRPSHLKALSPALLQRLHAEQQQQRQEEITASVISLLSLKDLPDDLLLPLLHAAAAAADTLQPRDIAMCLYSVQQQQQQQQQVMMLQQELKERLVQRAVLLLPSFPPEELLLFICAAGHDVPAGLLQHAFECLYAAVPFYTPHQLAVAFMFFTKSGHTDSPLRLRLLLQLLASADQLPLQPLCDVASALAATPSFFCRSQTQAEKLGETKKEKRDQRKNAPETRDTQTTEELLQQQWGLQLVDIGFSRSLALLWAAELCHGTAAAATAAAAAGQLLCSSFSIPARGWQQQLREFLMQPQQEKRQLQLHLQQEITTAATAAAAAPPTPLSRRRPARLLQTLEPPLLLQLLQLQLRQQKQQQAVRFIGAACAALRPRLQELNTRDLLSLVGALHASGLVPRQASKGDKSCSERLKGQEQPNNGEEEETAETQSALLFLPSRFCWKLGSLLKDEIESYQIHAHVLAQHAMALHSMGIWARLSAKTQATILRRLEENERNLLPLPPAAERNEPTSQRQVRVKNLALLKPKETASGIPSLLLVSAEEEATATPVSPPPSKTAIELFKEVVNRY